MVYYRGNCGGNLGGGFGVWRVDWLGNFGLGQIVGRGRVANIWWKLLIKMESC